MIPNDFGIIRQPGRDLMAAIFYPLVDAENCTFEIVQPEYIDGYRIVPAGDVNENILDSYAIVDISKYDYVYAPCISVKGESHLTGCRDAVDSGSLSRWAYIQIAQASSNDVLVSGYYMFKTHNVYNYLVINSARGVHPVIVGFIKKRSE